MNASCSIKAPFFEIGPKSYLYGDEILDLAKAADAASEKYGVDIIFTCPVVDIRRVKENTKHIHVFAPHMDPIPVGRGLADILPESLVAAGAEGVMLNHVEKPVTFEVLAETIKRAEEVGLLTIVCGIFLPRSLPLMFPVAGPCLRPLSVSFVFLRIIFADTLTVSR